MRIFFIIIGVSGFAFHCSGQITGNPFPKMKTYTAHNKVVLLPHDIQDKYALLVLAYSKKAEQELQRWFEPIFSKFVQKTTGIMEGLGYDVNVYFIPMFKGLNTAAMGQAQHQAIKKIDPEMLNHMLFYKGDFKTYKERLNLNKESQAYIFVLNPEGKVIAAVSGAYEESKMDVIEEAIE